MGVAAFGSGRRACDWLWAVVVVAVALELLPNAWFELSSVAALFVVLTVGARRARLGSDAFTAATYAQIRHRRRSIDGGNPKAHNQSVRRALSVVAGLACALAGAAIAGVCIAPIDFALTHGCAPTSHQAPAPYTGRNTCHDDARMAGEAVVPASGERSTFQSLTALSTGTLAKATNRCGAVTALRSASFTRPHDPSHLHAFVLLI